MGGTIVVDDAPGGGAAFSFTLPVSQVAPVQEPARVGQPTQSA
jgi:signal transduction histidine kinase